MFAHIITVRDSKEFELVSKCFIWILKYLKAMFTLKKQLAAILVFKMAAILRFSYNHLEWYYEFQISSKLKSLYHKGTKSNNFPEAY